MDGGRMSLFSGELVQLSLRETGAEAEILARWSRDTEYWRLRSTDSAYPQSARSIRARLAADWLGPDPTNYYFYIRTRAEDRLIGTVGLFDVDGVHGDAVVGIGLGERDCWGRGYGTDALRVLLRFAFHELNLRRVSLSVLSSNPRAMRSYEKAGFVYEGRHRRQNHIEGRRYDEVCMGILYSEWLAVSEATAVRKANA
jgi:RimJ/RimL family protein N-acetyltransferase